MKKNQQKIVFQKPIYPTPCSSSIDAFRLDWTHSINNHRVFHNFTRISDIADCTSENFVCVSGTATLTSAIGTSSSVQTIGYANLAFSMLNSKLTMLNLKFKKKSANLASRNSSKYLEFRKNRPKNVKKWVLNQLN